MLMLIRRVGETVMVGGRDKNHRSRGAPIHCGSRRHPRLPTRRRLRQWCR